MHEVTIRTVDDRDASALITYVAALRAERLQTLFRYDSVPTLEEELRFIRRFAVDNAAYFVALDADRIVGNLGVSPYGHPQTAHVAVIGMAVLAPYRGHGIGSRLLDHAIAWAQRSTLRKLELEVLSNNPDARRLYERKGFVLEGCRREAVSVDGLFVDSVLLARDVRPSS